MKHATLLLCASLAANAALGVALWRGSTGSSDRSPPEATRSPSEPSALRRALESHDFAALVAAGVSEETARRLVAGFAFERYRGKLRAAVPPPPPDLRWWRDTAGVTRQLPIEQQRAIAAAEREMSDTLTLLYGEGASLTGEIETRLAFLPTAKREAVLRLEQSRDAEAMYLRQSTAFTPMESDEQRRAAIGARFEAELAALLTPEERDHYFYGGSRSAFYTMERFGPGIENESDWRVLMSEFREHDRLFPEQLGLSVANMDGIRASLADSRQRYENVRQALGPERYAALQNAVDADKYEVGALQRRLGLPTDAVDRVIELRERYAKESQRVASAAANEKEGSAALKALASQARDELTAILGTEATDAYALRPNWVRKLGRGLPYSTNPSATSSLGPNAISYSRDLPWDQPEPAQKPSGNPSR